MVYGTNFYIDVINILYIIQLEYKTLLTLTQQYIYTLVTSVLLNIIYIAY